MKLYLAAPFARAQTVDRLGKWLKLNGHRVVSTWHKPGVPFANTMTERRNAAYLCLDDLLAADGIVCLTEPENATPFSSGGRHFEFGFAAAMRMPAFVLGPVENVYYALHNVRHASSPEDLLAHIHEAEMRKGPVR